MARYIDIDKFNKWFTNPDGCCGMGDCIHTEWFDYYDCKECYYENGGAEDVAPVVHAKWKSKLADNGWKDISCSKCNFTINVDVQCSVNYKYCPNCGSKMDKE